MAVWHGQDGKYRIMFQGAPHSENGFSESTRINENIISCLYQQNLRRGKDVLLVATIQISSVQRLVFESRKFCSGKTFLGVYVVHMLPVHGM